MGLYKVDETSGDLTLVAGLPSAGDVMDFKYINVTLTDLTSASGWTAPYAGIMMVNIPGNKTNAVGTFYVNGTLVSLNGTADLLYRGSTFAVPKGGVVTVADMSGSNNFYAVFAYITGNAVLSQSIYSTTETKTNKIWVDNKPIYRKCWSGLNIGTNEVNIGTINNIDTVVNIEASISQYTTTSATTLAFKKPYVKSQSNIDVKSNGIFCKSGSGFDRINVVVIEYTKNE